MNMSKFFILVFVYIFRKIVLYLWYKKNLCGDYFCVLSDEFFWNVGYVCCGFVIEGEGGFSSRSFW